MSDQKPKVAFDGVPPLVAREDDDNVMYDVRALRAFGGGGGDGGVRSEKKEKK